MFRVVSFDDEVPERSRQKQPPEQSKSDYDFALVIHSPRFLNLMPFFGTAFDSGIWIVPSNVEKILVLNSIKQR